MLMDSWMLVRIKKANSFQRSVLVLAVLLMSCAVAQAQDGNGLRIKYDRFEDATAVMTEHQQLSGNTFDGLSFFISAVHDGAKPKPPKANIVAVNLVSFATHRQFSNSDVEMIFLADGVRIKLRVFEGSTKYSSITRRYTEGLIVIVNLDTLKRLANSTTAEGKVGTKEFILTSRHKDVIKAFIEYFAKAE